MKVNAYNSRLMQSLEHPKGESTAKVSEIRDGIERRVKTPVSVEEER